LLDFRAVAFAASPSFSKPNIAEYLRPTTCAKLESLPQADADLQVVMVYRRQGDSGPALDWAPDSRILSQ